MIPVIKKDSNDEYHGNKEHIGSSMLKLYSKSPLHYNEHIQKTTKSLWFGALYHEFVLEEELFNNKYYIFDDSEIVEELSREYSDPRKSDRYIYWLLKYKEEFQDKKELPKEIYDKMVMMKDKLFNYGKLGWFRKYLLTGGVNEMSHYLELNGVKIKFRPDSMIPEKRIIADLKTTTNASKDGFINNAVKWGYHVSAAFYIDGKEELENDGMSWKFYFVAQETEYPYAPNIFKATQQFLSIGRYEYEIYLQLHKKCIEDNQYPGYEIWSNNDYGINDIDVPSYKIKEIMYNLNNFYGNKKTR